MPAGLFTTIKTEVSGLFVKLFGADAAAKFAVGAEALLKTSLGVIATDAVTATASLAATGDTAGARAAAFEKIGTDAAAQGIAVTNSVKNMLVELAVQKLQGAVAVLNTSTPTTSTPPADASTPEPPAPAPPQG